MALIWLFLPKDRVEEGASPLRELGAFRRKQVWFTLGIGAVGFGGLFSVFSYIASTATQVAHMPESAVPVMMALFGSGMILGNLVGAWFADKNLMGTIAGTLVGSIVVMTALWLTAENPILLSICVFLVGCTVAIGPSLQTRLMDVAADAQTLAAALNHSAFNIANALGAWLGGLAIAAGYGFAATGWVGAALAVCGLCCSRPVAGERAALAQRRPGRAGLSRPCDKGHPGRVVAEIARAPLREKPESRRISIISASPYCDRPSSSRILR